MKRNEQGVRRAACMLAVVAVLLGCGAAGAASHGERVAFDTSDGRFVVQLDPAKAPKTVANFLRYVREGFYKGTIFHRVVRGFIIQGGGYTADFRLKSTHAPIPDEAGNGLENLRGTIAMARTADPNSATSQFYINLSNNRFLDRRSDTPAGAGYAVFGRVVDGMQVVDRIAASPIGSRGPFPRDVPVHSVVIRSVSIVPAAGRSTAR
jgi:cyclophilin family peptidyl-prolyl cis-trans isomerase